MTGSTICCRENGNARQAWNALRLVSTNFFGNVRAEKNKELVEDMLIQYQKLGTNMLLCL